jgi:hypothetical protein
MPTPSRHALVLAAVLVPAALPACASKPKGPTVAPEAQLLGTEITGEAETERFDLNGDGKADLYRTYVLRPTPSDATKKERLLARQEIDLNFDDAIDVRRHFNEQGLVVREEMDLDFDTKFDAVDYYSGGVLYRRDMALNFDGRPSIVKFYEGSALVRKERDTKGTGRMDTFEYYDKGRLTRIGRDNDGDGVPETYTEVKDEKAAPTEPSPGGGDGKQKDEKKEPKKDDAPAESLGALPVGEAG